MRHENLCACGARKVAGAIACTECYANRGQRILPKSLHTVTVLENLTEFLMELGKYEKEDAMQQALEILDLDKLPDGHGLAYTALAKIKKGRA